MNIVRIMEQCDREAAQRHGWKDFAPVGLLVMRDGSISAITGYPIGTPIEQVGAMLTDAGRQTGRLYGLGMVCSAWASRTAVQDFTDPSAAEDRLRSRVAGFCGWDLSVHLFTNIFGATSYEESSQGMGGVGGVLSTAMFTLREELRPPRQRVVSTG